MAALDTTDGLGCGLTVCDLRGLYLDYPEPLPGVLALDGDFAPHLVETLLSFSESTTAAAAVGAAVA